MVLKQLGGADPAGTAVCFATDRQTEILTSDSRPTVDVSFPCWVFPCEQTAAQDTGSGCLMILISPVPTRASDYVD